MIYLDISHISAKEERMTNKQAARCVLGEYPGEYVRYRFVADEIQRRGLSGLSGKTPGNTIDRDLRKLVLEGLAETPWKGSGLFRLAEKGLKFFQRRMFGF